MDKKILIIAPYQFGELSDYYYWAKYATIEGWAVTYIGYKYDKREQKERKCNGVKVKSVKRYNNRVLLGIVFYLRCIMEILFHKHNNVFVSRTPHCQLLPMMFKNRNIILDVRTLSVSNDYNTRIHQDNRLRHLVHYFPTCSVISEGVGKSIGCPYHIVPLGAEELSVTDKNFDSIRLFYIGTFDNRNLHIFIKGLANYQKKSGEKVTFNIVGGGDCNEEAKLKEVIWSSGVEDVTMHGYLTHEEAKSLFDKCNIGVCYVPVTDYYQNQPPTKLYEYLLSGMAVIATNTVSNMEVVNKNNGIIITDTEEGVAQGLEEISKSMHLYDSKRIVNNSQKYHWKNIVNNTVLALAR